MYSESDRSKGTNPMTFLSLLFRPERAYRELSGTNRGLVQAGLIVISLAVVNVFHFILFNELPPVQPGLEWTWKVGVVIGTVVAVALIFLLWLYFVAASFLVLSLFGKVPNFAPITRVMGLSFFFLLLGRIAAILLQIAGISHAAANWIYSAFLIWALLEMALGLKSALRIPVIDAGFAVVLPAIVLELLVLLRIF